MAVILGLSTGGGGKLIPGAAVQQAAAVLRGRNHWDDDGLIFANQNVKKIPGKTSSCKGAMACLGAERALKSVS